MNFHIIKTLDDVLPFVQGNSTIRVKPDESTGLTVVCYMIQDEDTFAGPHEHVERECRGITFHANGTIAARCLHKFFNVGEREDTQPHALQWQRVTRIMEKRDGSMVTPVAIDQYGSFKFKTKKSFSTKEAALADELCSDSVRYSWVKKLLLDGFTPTFEVTSPRFPIVLKYDTDELTLLHVRENITGRYLTERELQSFTPPFPLVENLMEQFFGDGLPANLVSWEKLKAAAEATHGIEGWVIQFESGEMVKLKTAWYIELHHAVTFTRWRDIARTVCDDKADDLKGAFALTGRAIKPIEDVQHAIKVKIDAARGAAELHAEAGLKQNKTAKEMALLNKEHPLFGQIMRLFRGQEVNWMEWYVKHHLEQDWGLEVVEVNA